MSDVGILLEDERTNAEILYSLDYTQWSLNGDGGLSPDDTLGPDGELTASTFTSAAGGLTNRMQYSISSLPLGNTVFSCEVKKGTSASVTLRMFIGPGGTAGPNAQLSYNFVTEVLSPTNITTYAIEELADGWFRLWMLVDVLDTGLTTVRVGVVDAGSVLVGNSQLEVGASFPSSRIVNAGTEVTRPATDCQQTLANLGVPDLVNNFCGQIVFTAATDFVSLAADRFLHIIGATGQFIVDKSGSNLRVRFYDGVANHTVLFVPNDTDRAFDIRFSLSSSRLNVWVNSISGTATSSPILPEALDSVLIGQTNGGFNLAFITTHKLRIVPEALSDAEIEAWD